MRRTSGISLMLLIFLSLCMIIFSLLSLSGAVADETLSSQAADRTTEYYAAVSGANDLIAKIDAQLAAYLWEANAENAYLLETDAEDTDLRKTDIEDVDPRATNAEDAYLQQCSRISEDIPEVSWTDDEMIEFSIDVTDKQILQAALEVNWPASDEDTLYHIRTWKIVNTGEWNPNNNMNVFRLDKEE